MKSSRTLIVKERTALLRYLQSQYPETKRTALKQLLRHRAVFVNGNPVTRHDHVLEPKDRVVIERGAPAPVCKPSATMPEIVFEDRHIIVVNKPEGLLTIATEKETHRTAYRQVMAYVQEDRPHRGERIFIVHRLDRDTSGLLVFARTEEAKRAMQQNWESAEKKYYAVVEGVPREASGTIRSHLREHPKSLRMHSAPPSDEAKLAITKYLLIRSTRHFSLLEVKLETGRKNQIRAHLSEHGNPIVGDKKYDAHGNPIKRLGLHAYYLAFPHPISGKRLVFKTAIPEEFESLVNEEPGIGYRVSGFGHAKKGERIGKSRSPVETLQAKTSRMGNRRRSGIGFRVSGFGNAKKRRKER
ncbi:MAG: RluA family pseudouridine synthase [Candidatus Hydrogenedentes bacterium]|nr:RluA family pseudouridine synthase [Candidatus Hydrogenedentota bacterium]